MNTIERYGLDDRQEYQHAFGSNLCEGPHGIRADFVAIREAQDLEIMTLPNGL